jgi:hypothetical protein
VYSTKTTAASAPTASSRTSRSYRYPVRPVPAAGDRQDRLAHVKHEPVQVDDPPDLLSAGQPLGCGGGPVGMSADHDRLAQLVDERPDSAGIGMEVTKPRIRGRSTGRQLDSDSITSGIQAIRGSAREPGRAGDPAMSASCRWMRAGTRGWLRPSRIPLRPT